MSSSSKALGWLADVEHLPSPNFDERPDLNDIDLLVIHNISLPPGEFEKQYILDLFTNQLDPAVHPYFQNIYNMQVSAHFLIDREGLVTQLVNTFDRAWHAGQSCFAGRERCNDFSIGIELIGSDDSEFSPVQYQSLAALTRTIQQLHPAISNDRITGHSDIAAGRKTDPGPYFNWSQYKELIASTDK